MKRILQTYIFVALATFILLALLKLAGWHGITWGWVLLPIFGPVVMWLLVIGLFATVGLIWPKPTVQKGINYPTHFPRGGHGEVEEYRAQILRVDRDMRLFRPGQTVNEAHEAYYRKALAMELATLAHDTPGFIAWEKRGETLIGELKILVKND